jgi:hypothetical protein
MPLRRRTHPRRVHTGGHERPGRNGQERAPTVTDRGYCCSCVSVIYSWSSTRATLFTTSITYQPREEATIR